MAVTVKRVVSGKDKAHRRRRRDVASPPAKTFIRVYHSEALHQRTVAVLDALEQADDPIAHREALSNLIIELTGSAFDYCFMRPLRMTNPGVLLERTASLGLAGVQQVIGQVVHQVIGHMDGKQLLSISDSLRKFML